MQFEHFKGRKKMLASDKETYKKEARKDAAIFMSFIGSRTGGYPKAVLRNKALPYINTYVDTCAMILQSAINTKGCGIECYRIIDALPEVPIARILCQEIERYMEQDSQAMLVGSNATLLKAMRRIAKNKELMKDEYIQKIIYQACRRKLDDQKQRGFKNKDSVKMIQSLFQTDSYEAQQIKNLVTA